MFLSLLLKVTLLLHHSEGVEVEVMDNKVVKNQVYMFSSLVTLFACTNQKQLNWLTIW